MADDEFPFRYVPPPDPNLGRRVDLYFILRVLLGKGGMGAAYLAEHEALAHIKCVIKLVLAEMTHHPMVISRYKTEAHALAMLKHEGIVKLHGLGVLDDGQLYLRFEYVEGKSLDRYLADNGGRLPLRKAINFIFQLCSALQHAHDRGVIHRDLKPDNLMIEVDPPGSQVKERVKILDFGIAKVVSSAVDVTGSGIQMGTPTYMAPEQVTNAADVDGRADVFALAQVLYRMVTGKLPWGSPESSVEIYHRQRTQPPAWPAEDLMPREVAEVVIRALSLNPDDRPTAHEFAIELATRIKNGTELLAKVVPDWVTSLPHDATTLPHPVPVAPTPPAAPSLIADLPRLGRAGGLPPLNVVTFSPAVPLPEPVKDITAHARPRALATPAAPVVVPASHLPGLALYSPATPPVTPALPPFVPAPSRRPPTPVLAALPTGLASQQFAAQELPVEPRMPQVEVASEIELAKGTPGPLPYAHAELPAVLISNTQLSGLTWQVSAPSVSTPEHWESPPFVMLPSAPDAVPRRASSARSKHVLLGAACALAAVAAFAIFRLASHTTAADAHGSATISSDARPPLGATALAVPDAGLAGGPPEHLVLVPRGNANTEESPQAHAADPDTHRDTKAAGQIATAPPPHGSASMPASEKSASAPIAPRAVHSAPDQPNAPVVPVATATSQGKQASSVPETGRVPSSRTTQSQKTLRARQVEARSTGAKTGTLHLLVTPWAVCWIDGERIDQTPCMLDDLPVGRYRVRLENSVMHKVETLTATVVTGETTTIERAW